MPLPSLQEAAKMVLMDPQQVQQTEDSIRSLHRRLTGQIPSFDGATPDEAVWSRSDEGPADPEALQRSLERDRDLLKRHDPRQIHNSLTPYEKKQLWDRIQARIERIKQGMPNDEQLRRASAQDIDLLMRHEATHIQDILGLKTDLRLMDPDNDDANFLNIDRFRPIEPCHVDWRAYYEKYDEIAWQQPLASELEPLDEDRFQRFCQLKAAGWSAKGIKRELGFNEAQYEQAMERLRGVREQMADPEPSPEVVATTIDDLFDDPDSLAHPPTDRKAIGGWVKSRLEHRRLIKARVADAVGAKANMFSNYLNGHALMPEAVGKALIDWLMAFDAEPSAYASFVHPED